MTRVFYVYKDLNNNVEDRQFDKEYIKNTETEIRKILGDNIANLFRKSMHSVNNAIDEQLNPNQIKKLASAIDSGKIQVNNRNNKPVSPNAMKAAQDLAKEIS